MSTVINNLIKSEYEVIHSKVTCGVKISVIELRPGQSVDEYVEAYCRANDIETPTTGRDRTLGRVLILTIIGFIMFCMAIPYLFSR